MRRLMRMVGALALAAAATGCAASETVTGGASAPGGLSPQARERIRQAMPGTSIDSVSVSVVPGLHEVVAGRNVLYTDASGRYLVIGHIYDLNTATDITAARKASLSRIPWPDLPLAAAVTYGTGAKAVAVFSDPDCPWCGRLHAETLARLDNVTVHEILYPLKPSSRTKAEAVLCAENPGEALSRAFSGAQLPEPDAACRNRVAGALDAALEFGRKHAIHGTPAIVTPDGRTHGGFLPLDRFRAFLTKKED